MVQVWSSREKKSILNSLIRVLLHSCLNNAKQVKIILNYLYFNKQYFHSQIDVLFIVQIGPSRENNQSFHSLLYFYTPAQCYCSS